MKNKKSVKFWIYRKKNMQHLLKNSVNLEILNLIFIIFFLVFTKFVLSAFE